MPKHDIEQRLQEWVESQRPVAAHGLALNTGKMTEWKVTLHKSGDQWIAMTTDTPKETFRFTTDAASFVEDIHQENIAFTEEKTGRGFALICSKIDPESHEPSGQDTTGVK